MTEAAVDLPDVGEVSWFGSAEDRVVFVDGFTYRAEWIDSTLVEVRESVARLEKAKAFADSQRSSLRVEEAAKILHADMTKYFSAPPSWSLEPGTVRKGYKSAAKALLEAIDNGTV